MAPAVITTLAYVATKAIIKIGKEGDQMTNTITAITAGVVAAIASTVIKEVLD